MLSVSSDHSLDEDAKIISFKIVVSSTRIKFKNISRRFKEEEKIEINLMVLLLLIKTI